MWVKRFASYVQATRLPLIVESNHYGVSQYAESVLNGFGSTLWIELQSDDTQELERNAWGLPVARVIKTIGEALKIHAGFLAPETKPLLVVTQAERAPRIIHEVLAIATQIPHKIVISCLSAEQLNLDSLGAFQHLSSNDLRPGENEILEYFGSLHSAASWLNESAGEDSIEYEAFLAAKYARIGRPLPTPPSPSDYAAVTACITRQPKLFIDLLITNRHWLRAFELAVGQSLDRALELLDLAAEDAIVKNELATLFSYVSHLHAVLPQDEKILYWQIVIGQHLGVLDRRAVREALRRNPTIGPRLHILAFLAGETPDQGGSVPVGKQDDQLSLLLHTHIRALTNDASALKELFVSLRIFRAEGRSYRYAQTLVVVANTLILKGKYREASYWASQAISFLDKGKIAGLQKLLAASLLSYTYILSGEPVKARETLAPLFFSDELLSQPSADGILSTLGDQFAYAGHFSTAIKWYWEVIERFDGPAADLVLVDIALMLVRLNNSEEAIAIVRRRLSELEEHELSYPWVLLAWAIAHWRNDAEKAQEILHLLISEYQSRLVAPLRARAVILLALLLLKAKKEDSAVKLMSEMADALEDLALPGWQLLSGTDEHTSELYELWQRTLNPLKISFMGAGEWSYQRFSSKDAEGVRMKEIIYILSRFPQGLTAEQLAEYMGLPQAAHITIRSHIRRLREYLPLDARPYRLRVRTEADYLSLVCSIEAGDVSGVLDAYGGSLLPESDVPFIRDERRYLETRAKNLIVKKGTAEEIARFALIIGDDLELLEIAQELKQAPATAAKLAAAISNLMAHWDNEFNQS